MTCLALWHIIRCADAIRAVGEGRHMLICAQRLCVSGGAGGGVQYRGKCLWRCDEVEEGSQSGTAAQTPRSSLCIHRHYLHKYFIRLCAGNIRSFSIVFFWKDCLSGAREGQRWRPVVVYWRQCRAGSDWRGSLWKQSSVVYQHRYQLTFLSNLEGSILISEQRNITVLLHTMILFIDVFSINMFRFVVVTLLILIVFVPSKYWFSFVKLFMPV